MDSFSSLDLTFVQIWKEVLGSAPADWTQKNCADGHSSFLSFSQWWSRARPPVNLDIFRGCLRTLKSQYGRQPTYEDVRQLYGRRAGFLTEAPVRRAPADRCPRCDDTGVVMFATLKRGAKGYALDPARAVPALRPGEYVGCSTAPCACALGARQNERWHMPQCVVDRCNRAACSAATLEKMRGWVPETPINPKLAACIAGLSPAVAAAMLEHDDARRQANLAEYDAPPPEPEEAPF